jgi:hypothetical protein
MWWTVDGPICCHYDRRERTRFLRVRTYTPPFPKDRCTVIAYVELLEAKMGVVGRHKEASGRAMRWPPGSGCCCVRLGRNGAAVK